MADIVLVNSKPHSHFVSKQDAEAKYSALGARWWKQVIDGDFHCFGENVFDLGLHYPKRIEPGFLENARKAHDYAKEHLCEKLSLRFYKTLHKTACAHFKGKENGTLMHSQEAGRFRSIGDRPTTFTVRVAEFLYFHERNSENYAEIEQLITEYIHLKDLQIASRAKEEAVFKLLDPINPQLQKAGMRAMTKEKFLMVRKIYEEKATQVKSYVDHLKSANPGFKSNLPYLDFKEDTLLVLYKNPLGEMEHFDKAVAELFDDYNRTIKGLNAESPLDEKIKDKKLYAIADLFQKLEWYHPNIDGQGRTDILLLGKLLAENGFDLAILDNPYVSSFTTLDEWVLYLKEGMLKWRKEAYGA